MSKYFIPVEFPELEKIPKIFPVAEEDFPERDTTSLIVIFQQLLRAIESGESDISKSISLSKSSIHILLERFGSQPNKTTLINFLDFLGQEVNNRARQEAIKILKSRNKDMENYLNKIGI